MSKVLSCGIGGRQEVHCLIWLCLVKRLGGDSRYEILKGYLALNFLFILSLQRLSLKRLQLKLMNVLLFMRVHSKLDSCFLLKVGEGPRQPLPEARTVQHWLCWALCGEEIRSRDLQGGTYYSMCKGFLEAECWEQPARVKGRRPGMAPALGQLEDSMDVGFSLICHWRWAWIPEPLSISEAPSSSLCPISEDESLPLLKFLSVKILDVILLIF